jgi:hypothetical protein
MIAIWIKESDSKKYDKRLAELSSKYEILNEPEFWCEATPKGPVYNYRAFAEPLKTYNKSI